MYENQTQETIQTRMLGRVSDTLDKREGSIIQTSLGPVGAEIAQMYIELDSMMDESYADTQSREYLIRRASERGLIPIAATAAVVKAEFNLNEIPIGSRFACDTFTYKATEKIENKKYKLVCEQTGTAPNGTTGALISLDTITGLETAAITALLIPGSDEEDTEVFRQRYFDSFDTKPFGGNRTDYKNKTLAISGVGAVKVHRTSSVSGDAGTDGGNVRLVILDSDLEVPSASLVSLVKETMDPTDSSGEGYGIAPMWHHVHVEAATSTTVNIDLTMTFDTGYTYASLEEAIKAAIDAYLYSLKEDWMDDPDSPLIVRKTYIQSALLDIEGVLDAVVTALNGVNSNLTLGIDAVPKRGTITCS